MELSVSSRRSPKARQIDLLMAQLEPGDTLVVSELSRMGRSVGEVITTVDALLKQQVRFLAIKEGIRLAGKQDLHSKVQDSMARKTKFKSSWASRSQRRRLPRSPGSIARRSIISCALAILCPEVNDANGTGSPKDAGRQLSKA